MLSQRRFVFVLILIKIKRALLPGSLAAGCVTAKDSEGVPRRAPGTAQEEAGATAAAAVQQVPSPEPSATRRARDEGGAGGTQLQPADPFSYVPIVRDWVGGPC